MKFPLSLLVILVCCFCRVTVAQAPDARAALRVCTQNLHNYQPPARVKGSERIRKKSIKDEAALVERFSQARCDIIAVQEVLGRDERESLAILRALSNALSRDILLPVVPYAGESHDRRIRNGFLVVGSPLQNVEFTSLDDTGLPRLQPNGPPHYFRRMPVVLTGTLSANPKQELVFINMHLKSKADGWKDASGTQFEALRMEMAEALREYAASLQQKHPERVVIILGDRNADEGSASAEILQGTYQLADFRDPKKCRLDSQLRPLCGPGVRPRTPEFRGVFEAANTGCPKCPPLSSYRYRGSRSLLDEILLAPEHEKYLKGSLRDPALGVEGVFSRGSDHKLLWVNLEFPR